MRDDYARVVGAVALLVGGVDRAEDAVQEALVKAWTTTDEIRNLPGWVVQVALNEVRGTARRRKAEARAINRLTPTLSAVSDGPAPDRLIVATALDALPARQRDVAVLFYTLDLPVQQIADALGISAGTVKTSLSRARTALAAALSGPDTGHLSEASA